jgi:hypothetical protein
MVLTLNIDFLAGIAAATIMGVMSNTLVTMYFRKIDGNRFILPENIIFSMLVILFLMAIFVLCFFILLVVL